MTLSNSLLKTEGVLKLPMDSPGSDVLNLCEVGDFNNLRQRYETPFHLSPALRKRLERV